MRRPQPKANPGPANRAFPERFQGSPVNPPGPFRGLQIAIPRKQPETERLACRMIEQVLTLAVAWLAFVLLFPNAI